MSATFPEDRTPWLVARPSWYHRPTAWLSGISAAMAIALSAESLIWPARGHWGPGSVVGPLLVMTLSGAFSMMDAEPLPPRRIRGGAGWSMVIIFAALLALTVIWITWDYFIDPRGVMLPGHG